MCEKNNLYTEDCAHFRSYPTKLYGIKAYQHLPNYVIQTTLDMGLSYTQQILSNYVVWNGSIPTYKVCYSGHTGFGLSSSLTHILGNYLTQNIKKTHKIATDSSSYMKQRKYPSCTHGAGAALLAPYQPIPSISLIMNKCQAA
jgi:hypothetical protein